MSSAKLQFKILTPLGTVFRGSVDQVTVTTTSGEITILANHVPLVTTLVTGQVMVKVDGEPSYFSINGGVLEKRHDNTIYILSSRSEQAQNIDLERAQAAYDRAQRLMEESEKNPELQDYSNLKEVLAKELNRVRVGQKGKRR